MSGRSESRSNDASSPFRSAITTRSTASAHVAVMPAKLPPGLRIVREGRQYRLVAARAGRYKFKLEVVAKIIRAEPWNQISFTGPEAGIASVAAEAGGTGVELQLLSGTPLEPEKSDTARVRGVLGADRNVALRW